MTDKTNIKVEDIRKDADQKYDCIVQKALYYITEFLSGPMCGKCMPCSMGCYEAKLRIANIQQGEGVKKDIEVLKTIADLMLKSSMCKKGKDTAQYLSDWLKTDVFAEHVAQCCGAMQCPSMIQYRIISTRCTSCGLCLNACRFNAIVGETQKSHMSGYLPFEILNKRCNRCGDCIKVCPEDAIIITCME
ncbi:MAG: 4Fe-4S binding protein [Thermodesulfovibrionales bacterium]|nr:4Fe-4S binding protein [Thermodesulfovibrionales bacterium]